MRTLEEQERSQLAVYRAMGVRKPSQASCYALAAQCMDFARIDRALVHRDPSAAIHLAQIDARRARLWVRIGRKYAKR